MLLFNWSLVYSRFLVKWIRLGIVFHLARILNEFVKKIQLT